ncbi:MAG: helix-turn-helix transcriptional regulator [Rikenellaceae bacterium]|nr:helix-turn-helix transcriptional regulator [Rikenellaceae bacterium]
MAEHWRNDLLINQIAERLRKCRTAAGKSQEAVYFDTGIHIGKIETAQYNITVSTLSRLCQYYGITMEELLKGIEADASSEAQR